MIGFLAICSSERLDTFHLPIFKLNRGGATEDRYDHFHGPLPGRYIFNGTQTAVPEYSRSEDGVDHWRGDSWEGITVESSDPRLTGEASFVLDRDIYPGRVGAGWGTTLITNENGSWTGSGPSLIRPGDGNSWPGLDRMTGTGDYEGLSVVLLDAEGNGEFEAVIFPGPLPEGEYSGLHHLLGPLVFWLRDPLLRHPPRGCGGHRGCRQAGVSRGMGPA